jgi:formiminotetrahydrofolate cyclodeaminase
MALGVMQLAAQAAENGNLNAISDGATGAALACASLTGAGYNVRINVASLSDPSLGEALITALQELEAQAERAEARVRQAMVERGGIALP